MRIRWATSAEQIDAKFFYRDQINCETEHLMDFLASNIEVIHHPDDILLFEGIEPNQPYEMRFGKTLTADTFGPSDGSPTRNSGIDLCDIEAARAALTSALDDHEADDSQEHKWRLEQLFDEVFIAAIHSGLLVEKALVKACEAIENYGHIASARKRVIDAQLAKGGDQ